MDKTKTKTTYGVYNLIEWQALLGAGRARVKVPFTGGSITTQGVTPATYTTENPVIQFAIERSPEFRSGKIKVVRRVRLEGEIEIERNAPGPMDGGNVRMDEESEGTDEADRPEARAADAAQAPGPERMEFTCNDDAKDWLEQKWGFVRSKLRTREDIVTAGRRKGVEIVFV